MSKKSKNNGVVEDAEIVPAAQQALPLQAAVPATVPPSLIKEFTVPPEQQEPLRKTDQQGALIQKELGSLELQYLASKGKLVKAFEDNRQEYERLLKEAGKAVGVDFTKLTENERWDFDFNKMTFKHVDLPKPS
jgi:hypothetical protein